jgi:hypothetical protein
MRAPFRAGVHPTPVGTAPVLSARVGPKEQSPERTRVRLIRTAAGLATTEAAPAGPVVTEAVGTGLVAGAKQVAIGPVVVTAAVAGLVTRVTRAEAVPRTVRAMQEAMEAIRVVLRRAPVPLTLDRRVDSECATC